MNENQTTTGLAGTRVAVLEARMSGELMNLVLRYGGVPVSVPALREEPVAENDKEITAFIIDVIKGSLDVVIFLTGVGVTSLFREAEKRSCLLALCTALDKTSLVCRGPKPSAALRKQNLRTTVAIREPYTTSESIATLATMNLQDRAVGVVNYGERNLPLIDALNSWGARTHEVCLYEWLLPEDTEPLKRLVSQIIEGYFDAVLFTTQIQARHLFTVAREMGKAGRLARALKTRTVVAAVGPTCAAALEILGVTPAIVPERPKMGAMVADLARYFDERNFEARRELTTTL